MICNCLKECLLNLGVVSPQTLRLDSGIQLCLIKVGLIECPSRFWPT